MNNDAIARILSQPAHPGEPSTPTKRLAKKTKQQLDVEGVTRTPLKELRQLPYGNDPFSQRAIRMKREEDVTAGRNVAIVVFQSPNSKEVRHTIARTDGPPGPVHAEIDAYDKVPAYIRENKENILHVFTERKPCLHCTQKLKSVLSKETPVSYAAPHTPDKARQRENEAMFQKEQAELGVRVARQKKSKKRKGRAAS